MRKSNKYRDVIRPSPAKEEARWRAESDLRTLMEAETIKCDPARMKAARALVGEKKEELQAVALELTDSDKD